MNGSGFFAGTDGNTRELTVEGAAFPDYESSSDCTGARVLAQLTPALRSAVEGNAVVEVAADGTLKGPVGGLDIMRIGQIALKQGSILRKHFDAYCRAIMCGHRQGDTVSKPGWSASTHDRNVKKAAEVIAKWINGRRAADGQTPNSSTWNNSYRLGLALGDPACAGIEHRLAALHFKATRGNIEVALTLPQSDSLRS